MANKTQCPVTRDTFIAKAPPVTVTLFGTPMGAVARRFAEDAAGKCSVGYHINGKVTVMVDGKPVQCQVGINITAIGSKDLPATSIAETVKAAHAAEDAAKATEPAVA